MSNAKPYLFGAVLGASAMYVALQYHVVHSHDGFQMVPRTPQHSIGLAYADVRHYSASQWVDRPELARALMAHGASDLISESVANSLADSVAEENSTLDQLRSFLDTSAAARDASSAPGFLEIPATDSKLKRTPKVNDNDLTRIPFPQDAKSTVAADPFRMAQNTGTTESIATIPRPVETSRPAESARPAETSRFSTADVIQGLRDNGGLGIDSFRASPSQPSTTNVAGQSGVAAPSSSTLHDAQVMENRIFGSATSAATVKKPATSSSATESMFEEVTTQLENRAEAALRRAQDAATANAGSGVTGAVKESESYLRQRLETPVAPARPSGSAESAAKSAGSMLNQFDPFLE